MAWNGLGTYILSPVFSPEVNGTIIDAARYNGLTNDIAAGISFCLAKDGENSPIADLPMAGYKHTGVGDASATGQYLAYGQVPLGTELLSTSPTEGANLIGYDYSDGYDVDTVGQTLTGLLDSVQEVFGTTDQIVITADTVLQQLTWSLPDDVVVVNSITAPGGFIGAASSVAGQTASNVPDTVVVRGPTGNFAGNLIASNSLVTGVLEVGNIPNVNPAKMDYYLENPTLSGSAAITFGGASVGLTATYAGEFTRTGNILAFSYTITFTAIGSSVGVFAMVNPMTWIPAGTAKGAVMSCYCRNMTGLTGAVKAKFSNPPVPASPSYIELYQSTATGDQQLTNALFTNTSEIQVAGVILV